jgi:hypothetical protein
MVTYLPRSAWKARAARGSTGLVRSQVDGTALHWPGMAKPINAIGAAGQARVASALRGWQNYHMDGRGWSDIAYCVAVDQAGRAWTLRGINIRSGANGDADVNRRYGAILLILAPGEQPSAAMKTTVKGVVADFRRRFPHASATPKGHKDVRTAGTDCPGPLAYAAIKRGDFTPGTAPEPPAPKPPAPTPLKDDDVALTPAQEAAIAKAGWLADQFAQGAQFETDLDGIGEIKASLATLTTTVNALAAKFVDGGDLNNQLDRIEADTDVPKV